MRPAVDVPFIRWTPIALMIPSRITTQMISIKVKPRFGFSPLEGFSLFDMFLL